MRLILFGLIAFVLFSEAIAGREEVPATLFVQLPHVRLLTGVFGVGFVDQMHEKEHIVGKVVLAHCVNFKAVRHLVKVLFAYSTYETIRL